MSTNFPLKPSDSETEALPIDSYFGNAGRTEDFEENVMVPSAISARDEDVDVAFWNIDKIQIYDQMAVLM